MKKRILSWILAVCMLLAFVPAAAAADVTSLTISGIPIPADGDKLSGTPALILSSGTVASFEWKEVNNAEVDAFREGRRYRWTISVRPDSGCAWASELSMSALTGETSSGFALTVYSKNGTTLDWDQRIVSPDLLTVSGIVVCEAGKEKRDVAEIVPTADVLPAAGNTPNLDRYEITGGSGGIYCRWTDKTAGKDLTASDKFEAGHDYTVVFFIKPGDTWEWKEKSDGFADVTVKFYTDVKKESYLTAERPQLSYEQDGTKLLVSFALSCPAPAAAKKIAYVEITPKPYWFPLEGRKPAGKDDFTASNDCSVDSAVWRDESTNSYLMAAGVFEGGKKYELSISLLPPKDADWDDPAKLEFHLIDGEGGGWVAKSFSIREADGGRMLTAVWSFDAISKTEALPETVIVSGVKRPAAGQALPFDGITVNAGEILDITWTDMTDGNWYERSALGSTGSVKAIEGHEYALAVQIKPPAGNSWPYTEDANGSKILDIPAKIETADGSAVKKTNAFVSGWAPGTQIEVLRVTGTFVYEEQKPAPVPSAIEFGDVAADKWYAGWVYDAVAMGLINGKGKNAAGEDYFDPDGYITLAEAVKLAACMHQLYHNGTVTLKNGDPWYASYADYAQWTAGILVSWGGPGFSEESVLANPGYVISREEFAWIFARSLPEDALPVVNNIPDDSIPDVTRTSTRYHEEIYALYRAGILNGKDERGTYYPGEKIQRSEVAAIVVRMMKAEKRVGPPAKLGQ